MARTIPTVLLTGALLFVLSIPVSEAATLFLSSSETDFSVGDTVTVQVRVDTDDTSINAAQANIQYPVDLLELVEIRKTGSIFNFWIEEPSYANDTGTASFIGGTPKGVTGESLQVLELVFAVTGTGIGELSFFDAAITASDGKGTDILSAVQGIGFSAAETSGSFTAPDTVSAQTEEPQKVVKEVPVLSGMLPSEPVVRVPLYPNPELWYNHIGEVTVLWDVPEDVIRTAVSVDQSPFSIPPLPEPELFTGKKLGALTEGVWYVHVQFRNNIGWGPVTHFRIAIDVTPPLPFEATIDNAVSDNPAPLIGYEAHDELSGIGQVQYYIDGVGPLSFLVASTSAAVAPQAPGPHILIVRVSDHAGNSVEDDLAFEVLPLPQPTLTFLPASVAEDEVLFISGKAVPNGFAEISIEHSTGEAVFSERIPTDRLGNWELAVENALSLGAHYIFVTAADERGAVSYPLGPESFRVTARTLFSVGGIDLSVSEVFALVVLILFAAGGFAGWYYVRETYTRKAYTVIAGRDLEKFTDMLTANIEQLQELQKKQGGGDPHTQSEIDDRFNRIQDKVAKLKKYLGAEIKKGMK